MDSDSLLQMTCCTGQMRCCFRPRKTAWTSTQKDYPCRPVSRTHQLSATSLGWMKSDPCSPQQEYTHAHTHSEISLRKAACYLQPFKHVFFFIAIVFDTTLCVKEPLILASPLFFHSPVSFTLSRSSFIPVPFSFSSLCLFFSHPFHFFQHVGLVCIALLFWVSIEGKVCVKRDDFTSDSTGAIIVAGREKENNICNLFFLDQNFMNTYRV